jgi:hypothetical protein
VRSEPACGCALAAACWLCCGRYTSEVPPSLGLAAFVACGLTVVSHSTFPGPESPHLRWMMGACVLFAALCPKYIYVFLFMGLGALSCLVTLSNTRPGWANAPRWGERQRRWLAALLPPPQIYLDLRVVQAITRVALSSLCLVPRLVNVASCARSIFCPVPTTQAMFVSWCSSTYSSTPAGPPPAPTTPAHPAHSATVLHAAPPCVPMLPLRPPQLRPT